MKAKIVRGSGFRGAVGYALDEGPRASGRKHAELIGGNLAGRNSDEIAAEFGAVRRLRPDIERPVWHTSLSAPAGERLSAEQWEAVAADFLARMGFDPATTPWIAARHSDTEYDHLHIIASRVGIDGRVWHGKWEARHAIEATQQIEIAHGLQRTKGLDDARAERKKPRDGERRRAERTGEVPARTRLQQAIDEAIEAGARDVPALVEALAERGVSARPNVASNGKVSGFSFALDAEGVAFRGSDLGKRYSWAGLQRAGIAERREVAEPMQAGELDQVEPETPPERPAAGVARGFAAALGALDALAAEARRPTPEDLAAGMAAARAAHAAAPKPAPKQAAAAKPAPKPAAPKPAQREAEREARRHEIAAQRAAHAAEVRAAQAQRTAAMQRWSGADARRHAAVSAAAAVVEARAAAGVTAQRAQAERPGWRRLLGLGPSAAARLEVGAARAALEAAEAAAQRAGDPAAARLEMVAALDEARQADQRREAAEAAVVALDAEAAALDAEQAAPEALAKPRRAPEAIDRQSGAPEARRPAPEAQADPLDYWRAQVAQAVQSGDADAVELARWDLAAAERVVARGAPPEPWIVGAEYRAMVAEQSAAQDDDDAGLRRR